MGNYNILYEDIQERLRFLSTLIDNVETAIKEAPGGTLKIRNRKNGTSYYSVTNKSEIYLPQKNVELIQNLAQKSYDKRILRAAQTELLALEKLSNYYSSNPAVEEWYGKLSPARQSLVHPVVLTDKQYIAKWKKEHPPRSSGKPETVYETIKGDTVRSRAEILIADRLFTRNVIYQHETPLILNGVEYHPDFCVLNLRKRKTLYWEHLGMMDELDYLEDNIFKLNRYAKHNIIIGKNLIITFETATQPFNTAQIDQMIQAFCV